jgi:hypothetical protein
MSEEKEWVGSLDGIALSSSSCKSSGGRPWLSSSDEDSSYSGRGRIVMVWRRVSFLYHGRCADKLTGGRASPAGNGGAPLASVSASFAGDRLTGLACSSGSSTSSIVRFFELVRAGRPQFSLLDSMACGVRACDCFNGLPLAVVLVLSFASNNDFRGVVLALGVRSPSTRRGDGLTGDAGAALYMLLSSVSCIMAGGVAIFGRYAFQCCAQRLQCYVKERSGGWIRRVSRLK